MKLALKIIKAVLVIFLTLTIIGIIAIKISSSTILNEAYIFKMLQTGKYYNNIYEELKSNFENYIGPSGLDENILENICTVEDVQKDTETILGNIYEGTNKKVDTEAIKQRVVNNINKAIEQEDEVNITQTNIDEFAKTISEEYINTISHTEYEEKINESYSKAIKITNIGQKALFIAAIIILILLIVLNLKTLYLAVSNIGIALLASGTLYVVSQYIINSKVNIQHIKVLNNSISTILQTTINDILNQFVHVSWILIAVGILCIIVGNFIKIKNTEE